MGTTAEKLAKIEATKADIKQSIIEKGVTVPSDATFASYPGYIDQISTGIVPTGNIELQQKTGTDVTNYATASVKSGSVNTPATTKQQSKPTFSQSGNVVTASVAATSVSVTPNVGTAGWISSGTAGTITMSANSNTYTIPSGSATTPATTITQSTPTITVSGSTITVNVAQKTQSVTPTVSAGYISSGTAGTITLGASSNTASINYNIYRTGSGTPSSSLGNNGDLYVDIS